MDVHERIRGLMEERGWSEYRLAQKAGLSQSAISNLFRRHTLPSIPTLEAICNGFGLTLSQFFCSRWGNGGDRPAERTAGKVRRPFRGAKGRPPRAPFHHEPARLIFYYIKENCRFLHPCNKK